MSKVEDIAKHLVSSLDGHVVANVVDLLNTAHGQPEIEKAVHIVIADIARMAWGPAAGEIVADIVDRAADLIHEIQANKA